MLGKIRFYLALWASKLLLFIYKIIGNEQDDKPGLLAYKICPDFMGRLNKPKLVVGVTGTNGKSTVSNIVCDILRLEGLKVQYNDWFANTLAGHARCLLDAVTIFNKPRKDAAVLEMDEMTLPDTMPYANLNYLIVTNICRDSIRRNAYPSFIAKKLEQAFEMSPKTTLILNADDPISSFIKHKNKDIYYSIEKTRNEIIKYNANDFPICPRCHKKIKYEYQHYRHIGKVSCSCGFKSKQAKYIGNNINYDKMTFNVCSNKKLETYKLLSKSLFNVFNILSIITFLKEYGLSEEKINKYLQQVKIPTSREDKTKIDNKEIILQIAKGQNISASSTVFEYVSKIEGDLEVILLLDEICCKKDKTETLTWLYETDFKFLKKDNIKKIIVGSYLSEDYKAVMIMQGIDENKIYTSNTEFETINHITFNGIDKILILYEIEFLSGSKELKNMIVEKYRKEKESEN